MTAGNYTMKSGTKGAEGQSLKGPHAGQQALRIHESRSACAAMFGSSEDDWYHVTPCDHLRGKGRL